MAEIYCKRCLHHEELGRPLRADETCPACGAGVHRRKGKAPRPLTHFPAVLRAIFSLRGIAFLVVFSLFGMIPIGPLAWASIIMLFLGSLKLAMKTMSMVDGKVAFPEVSPEELFDKSALIPALAFVFLFVWTPPILLAFAASGVFTIDPGISLPTSPTSSTPAAVALAPAPKTAHNKKDPGGELGALGAFDGTGGLDPAAVNDMLAKAGISQEDLAKAQADPQGFAKALQSAPSPDLTPHLRAQTELDAPRVACGILGLLLFLWAPMALVLYLRTSSTLAMVWVPAGARTMMRDPGGYFVLCFLVLPALAARFLIDAYTSTTLIAMPP
ncbi:MAG TPA: hypothetical protein VGO62_19140, partial [Myxococcota bacterium]